MRIIFIWLGVRPYLLVAVTVSSEPTISSSVLVSDSSVVLSFSKDLLESEACISFSFNSLLL